MNIVAGDVVTPDLQVSPDFQNLLETGVKAYDQEIINQNAKTPLFLFVAILLLANA